MLAGALLTLFFAWNGSQTFEELEAKQSVMIGTTPIFISITGARALTIVHSIFSMMAGLVVESFSCFSLFITLCNRLKMSKYKAYWRTDFPLIIYLARTKK